MRVGFMLTCGAWEAAFSWDVIFMSERTVDAYVTMFGFPDNDPPFSANIAHPVLHQEASGIGTFEDPITFAGDPKDIPFGTKIYVPYVQKYFIMEDTCANAMESPNDPIQADLWAGGTASSNVKALLAVENASRKGSLMAFISFRKGIRAMEQALNRTVSTKIASARYNEPTNLA